VFDARKGRRWTTAVSNARKFVLRAAILLALTGTLLLVLATPVIAGA
jgi:hypothetical protein